MAKFLKLENIKQRKSISIILCRDSQLLHSKCLSPSPKLMSVPQLDTDGWSKSQARHVSLPSRPHLPFFFSSTDTPSPTPVSALEIFHASQGCLCLQTPSCCYFTHHPLDKVQVYPFSLNTVSNMKLPQFFQQKVNSSSNHPSLFPCICAPSACACLIYKTLNSCRARTMFYSSP